MEVLTDIFRTDFDGITIDYEVKYEVTGKIIASKPLIFDLPINGQRIILGDNQEEIKNKIVAFERLIGLIIPLGIHNQESFFNHELHDIITRINDVLVKEGLEIKDLHKYCDEYSVEYYIHSAHSIKGKYPSKFLKLWDKTREVILNRNKDIQTDNLRFLGYHYPQFGFKILPLIIPFINNSNTKRIAYENLDSYISDESFSYLIGELRTCKEEQILSGILASLAKHDLGKYGIEIQKELIRLYRSEIVLGETSKANLLDVLVHFPNQDSIDIGVEILKSNNSYSGDHAARLLLKIGFPAKEIVEILLPKFLASDPVESVLAYSVFCNSNDFASYLPESNELLDIFSKTIKDQQNLNIVYSMPSILKQKYTQFTSREIIGYLTHSNANVLEAILILISCLLNDEDLNAAPFYTQKVKTKYLELLFHDSQSVVENNLNVLQKIGREEAQQSYIDLFLSVINFEKDNIVNLYAMRAINHVLPALDFDDKIVPYYKKALENTNYNYREAALRGLRYSSDSDLIKSLDYLKDDPAEDVRNVAYKLHLEPKRDEKPSRFTRILRYIRAKITNEERSSSRNESYMEYLMKIVEKNDRIQLENLEKYKLK